MATDSTTIHKDGSIRHSVLPHRQIYECWEDSEPSFLYNSAHRVNISVVNSWKNQKTTEGMLSPVDAEGTRMNFFEEVDEWTNAGDPRSC